VTRTLVSIAAVLAAACGSAAPPPSPPAADRADPADPAVADDGGGRSCADRIARVRPHLDAVLAHADDDLARAKRGPTLSFETVDGTERDPEAIVIRYAMDRGVPTIFVGADPGIPWKGATSVAAVTRQMLTRSGLTVAELELDPVLDAPGFDALLVALSGWVHVRLIVGHTFFDRDRIVLAPAPAWSTRAFEARLDDRPTLMREDMARAIRGCAPLQDAFGRIESAQDLVAQVPAALAECDCAAASPEAIGTLAAMVIAVADFEPGWLEIRATASGGTPLAIGAADVEHLVTAIAGLDHATRTHDVGVTLAMP
jgi:hypothetical protein